MMKTSRFEFKKPYLNLQIKSKTKTQKDGFQKRLQKRHQAMLLGRKETGTEKGRREE
jgi:hypothetical protein